MSTAFATVVGALVSTLAAAPAVSAQIHRVRLRPMAQAWATAVVVRPLGVDLQTAVGQGVACVWTTAVVIECYARAAPGTTADVAVDAVLQAVTTRLLANRSLGGTVGSLDLSAITYDFDTDAEATACATLTYQVRHATAANTV